MLKDPEVWNGVLELEIVQHASIKVETEGQQDPITGACVLDKAVWVLF